jgi:hypothetical protein
MIREYLQTSPFAISLDRKEFDSFFHYGMSRADFLLFERAVVCEIKEIERLDIEKQVQKLASKGKMPTDVFNQYFCNSIIKALRKGNDQIADTKRALTLPNALGLIVLENRIPAKMSALTLVSVANQTMNTGLSTIDGALCLDLVNYFEREDGDKVRPCQLLLRPTEQALNLRRPCEMIIEGFCKQQGIPLRRGFNLDSADQLWHAGPDGTYQKYTANITFVIERKAANSD